MDLISPKQEQYNKYFVELDYKKLDDWKFKAEAHRIKIKKENYKINLLKINRKRTQMYKESDNLTQDLSTNTLLDKKIEKSLVENYFEYPTYCIGQLINKFNIENSDFVILGTATLIGPNLLLTSASNILRTELGNYTNIIFYYQKL